MYRILFILLLLISTILSNQLKEELPIGFTPSEWENRDMIKGMGHRTDPPPGPVRNVAEYEPMQGVLIRYPFGISTSIIREMAEDVIVYCLVSSGSQNSAYNSMNNANVNMDNVEFILGSTDSYWTRDYGPWWVVDGNGDVGRRRNPGLFGRRLLHGRRNTRLATRSCRAGLGERCVTV